MLDAGTMFDVPVRFRDRAGLSLAWDAGRAGPLELIETNSLVAADAPGLIAIENTSDSRTIFGAPVRIPSMVLVGNERRGVARDLLAASAAVLHIPMAGRRTDTLNVAAAAATALYFLRTDHDGGPRSVTNPEGRRPALYLMGPTDHVEAGSTLRSAAGLGWRSARLDDRHGVWFDTPRPTRTEGRAAARSHRNDLRVARASAHEQAPFKDVIVATAGLEGPPLTQGHLADGSDSVLVLPDERGVDLAREDWERLGARVRFVNIDLPRRVFDYRYRLTATIALVESARQIGTPKTKAKARPSRPKGLGYDSTLDLHVVADIDTVSWQELTTY